MNVFTGKADYVQITVDQSEKMFHHTRKIYSILDFFGDFGGLLEVCKLVIEFVIGGWAEHLFVLKALQKLYLVSTESEIFRTSGKDENRTNLERINKISKRKKKLQLAKLSFF